MFTRISSTSWSFLGVVGASVSSAQRPRRTTNRRFLTLKHLYLRRVHPPPLPFHALSKSLTSPSVAGRDARAQERERTRRRSAPRKHHRRAGGTTPTRPRERPRDPLPLVLVPFLAPGRRRGLAEPSRSPLSACLISPDAAVANVSLHIVSRGRDASVARAAPSLNRPCRKSLKTKT